MKVVLKTAFFIFMYAHAIAQNNDANALLKKIRESKEDTNRVLAYIDYGQLLENNNLDSAGKYYLKAEALSQKLNYDLGRCNSVPIILTS